MRDHDNLFKSVVFSTALAFIPIYNVGKAQADF